MKRTDTIIGFVKELKENLESWRAGDLDYPTYNECQQVVWAAIRAAGSGVETAVIQTLSSGLPAPRPRVVSLLGAANTRIRRGPRRGVADADTPRLRNRLYRIEGERCDNGNQILRVTPTSPNGRGGAQRARSAFVYELAAALERRSEGLWVRWTICPDATSGQVTIGTTSKHEAALAAQLAADLIAEIT